MCIRDRLSPDAFEVAANEVDALVLDTRAAQDFAAGFIPNSINIGLDGSFAPWVGALIPGVNHPLLLVTPEGRELETVTRLARVGYSNVIGYLEGGFTNWKNSGKESDSITSIAAEEFASRFESGKLRVIDVRKPGEFSAEHVDGAESIPLDFINERLASVPAEEEAYVYCAGGYRSMIALSILRARGWNNLIDVQGGYKAISGTRVPRTDFVCASTARKG